MDDQIIALSLAAVAIVKVLVDLVKLGWVALPQWVPPLLALIGGPVIVALLMIAGGQLLTQQALAQAVLAGILAGGGAVGVTELANRAQFPKSKVG